MTARELPRAQAASAQLMSRSAELRDRAAPDNLLLNASFEEPLLNGGFEWRYEFRKGVKVEMDSSELHHGSRSLQVVFDGRDVFDIGVYQLIPVESGQEYQLTGFLKAAQLETASGVRIAVLDADGREVLAMGDEVSGSGGWQPADIRFRGPGSRLVRVTIARVPSDSYIRGSVFFDDLHLAPVHR